MHGKVVPVKKWAGHPGFCLLFHLLCGGYICILYKYCSGCFLSYQLVCYEHNTIGHQFLNQKQK